MSFYHTSRILIFWSTFSILLFTPSLQLWIPSALSFAVICFASTACSLLFAYLFAQCFFKVSTCLRISCSLLTFRTLSVLSPALPSCISFLCRISSGLVFSAVAITSFLHGFSFLSYQFRLFLRRCHVSTESLLLPKK